MFKIEDIAFKLSAANDVLVFVKKKHVGEATSFDKTGWKRLAITVEGVTIERTIYMPDADTARKTIAEIINFELQYQAPFRRLKELKRITRKDINACLTHIVENEYRMSKDDIVKFIRDIVAA